MKNDKIMVLFLCNANMCRSQMAEGWANHLKGDSICAFSAGIAPGHGVSRTAVDTMREAGVDISGGYAKGMDELPGIEFDYVVTLSPEAGRYCPKFGRKTKILHRPIEEPLSVLATAARARDGFKKMCEEIRALIETMPESLPDE